MYNALWMTGQGDTNQDNDARYANFLIRARRHDFSPAADNFALIAALVKSLIA